jgi:hypothetical protein
MSIRGTTFISDIAAPFFPPTAIPISVAPFAYGKNLRPPALRPVPQRRVTPP